MREISASFAANGGDVHQEQDNTLKDNSLPSACQRRLPCFFLGHKVALAMPRLLSNHLRKAAFLCRDFHEI